MLEAVVEGPALDELVVRRYGDLLDELFIGPACVRAIELA
jgi:hypothetical protein